MLRWWLVQQRGNKEHTLGPNNVSFGLFLGQSIGVGGSSLGHETGGGGDCLAVWERWLVVVVAWKLVALALGWGLVMVL